MQSLYNLFECEQEHFINLLIEENIKRCAKCFQIKSRTEFSPHSGFDGLYSRCKTCEKEDNKTDDSIRNRKLRNQTDKYKQKARDDQKKRKQDPIKRLNDNFSSLLSRSLSKYGYDNISKGFEHWETLVGYSLQELINHLESQFYKDSRISWNNYGQWHVDHIKPRSSFCIHKIGDDEFKECWSLKNLQPLWGLDNLKKSNTIILDGDIV